MMVDQPERPCQAFAVAIQECVVLKAKCVIDDLVKNGEGKIEVFLAVEVVLYVWVATHFLHFSVKLRLLLEKLDVTHLLEEVLPNVDDL